MAIPHSIRSKAIEAAEQVVFGGTPLTSAERQILDAALDFVDSMMQVKPNPKTGNALGPNYFKWKESDV